MVPSSSNGTSPTTMRGASGVRVGRRSCGYSCEGDNGNAMAVWKSAEPLVSEAWPRRPQNSHSPRGTPASGERAATAAPLCEAFPGETESSGGERNGLNSCKLDEAPAPSSNASWCKLLSQSKESFERHSAPLLCPGEPPTSRRDDALLAPPPWRATPRNALGLCGCCLCAATAGRPPAVSVEPKSSCRATLEALAGSRVASAAGAVAAPPSPPRQTLGWLSFSLRTLASSRPKLMDEADSESVSRKAPASISNPPARCPREPCADSRATFGGRKRKEVTPPGPASLAL
mmetsp:Transcript_11942/g.32290  ORF Transcript_11942/g.32290 Transcript_11942/m.32290 type:complete len:289 (-) Transcript_11942:13-879(-)